VLALVALLAGGCGGSAETTDEAGGAIAVTTEAARLETMRDAITINGAIAPAAAADYLVTAPEPAQIAELSLNEGDLVQQGDVLVRFDIPSVTHELSTRELELTEAQHRLERAQADAERLNRLFEQGLTSRNSWEAARSALSSAEANLSSVKARSDAAKGLAERAIVRARFSGMVHKRFKSQGEIATGGDQDPVMRIIDPTRLQVVAQVPLGESARIAPGLAAQVIVAGVGQAAVVAAKPPAPPNATAVEVRFDFVAPTSLPIDTPVQIDILLAEREGVLVVPADAIQRADGTTFVWVPDENGQAQRRVIAVGSISGRLAQVTSGLAPGDRVIVTGIAQLTDGAPVQITR
jgi:RND family efflux transporter MFP subunit